MKKSLYKSAMSHVKTSEDFNEVTYQKLLSEMNNTKLTTINNHNNHKERVNMQTAKKRAVKGWTIGIAACAVLAVGTFTMNQSTLFNTQSPSAVNTTKPPVTGKAAVNIEGVISEVSADGKSFKVGDLWVTVTDATELGIKGPNAAKPSEELLQKEFKVGNIVSGYTSQDISTGKVTADNIYNNMAPQKDTSSNSATTGKAAVNIEGVISEVSADGKSFKVGDLWVTVTDATELGIKGPTAAKPSEELLQKEFKVGNIVSGYTSQDISTGKVTADNIYNNMAPQKDTSSNSATTGKAAVNIEGVISEVSADGKSFKVGDLWVTVTDATELGIKGPTAAKPSEELLQKEFKVGNIVSGYTSQDISTGKVTADNIYNNMTPQKDAQ
ncbi:hypothetical protein A8L34_20035 [Bacillus sp. FJAT-27264]|uniref:DUF5666 domain-containing protein n=1 Tax=Paenibacillus sp. (strain DSM 101736 / FJAT-27264) TaxID=1850362 RepID=UPI000807E9BD|nr:DUF5666 domain-containing protein [Bacillus sp. FJAT-27264]OBZ09578.1 hypothetical protein A8L34_20035 [Bacillus sp. FJAT-27264]